MCYVIKSLMRLLISRYEIMPPKKKGQWIFSPEIHADQQGIS
jgi:hypothetical protein